MNGATFRVPSTIHYGEGTLDLLGETARQLGFGHALVVTDPGVVRLGVAGQAKEKLGATGIRTTLFDGVEPDPTLANVEAGLARLRGSGCDGLVAVGGGSSIDCAKAMLTATPFRRRAAHLPTKAFRLSGRSLLAGLTISMAATRSRPRVAS